MPLFSAVFLGVVEEELFCSAIKLPISDDLVCVLSGAVVLANSGDVDDGRICSRWLQDRWR